MSCGNVVWLPSKRELLLSRKPFEWECNPVRIQAREGPQMELAQKLLWNIAPSEAIRSRFGVGAACAKWLPYAEIADSAWSSEKMNRMFGRSAAMAKLLKMLRRAFTAVNVLNCMCRI